jgi:hypothetical protein
VRHDVLEESHPVHGVNADRAVDGGLKRGRSPTDASKPADTDWARRFTRASLDCHRATTIVRISDDCLLPVVRISIRIR